MFTKKFPTGFLWGTATAAHQIEGNNKNSDWWKWEQRKDYSKNVESDEKDKYPLEPSLIACDSYNRYEEDFDLCVKMNNNAVRISVEWARIEHKEGVFDEKEILHYKKVLKAAKDRNLKVFLTLQHFTLPLWLSEKGGWANVSTPKYFSRYAKKCAQEFGELVDSFLTINEPQVYIYMSYTKGTWPPNKRNPFLGILVQFNMIFGHRKAYSSIKSVSNKYSVGIVKNIVWEYASEDKHFLKILDVLVAKIMYWFSSGFLFSLLKGRLDLIGLNYYFTNRIKNLKLANVDDKLSDLGWWIHPKGLENVLLTLKKYNLPIYITENGVADKDDRLRKDFIEEMLVSCHNAIEKGVKLKGYFHWSLLDNYEWQQGFWPRFGLIEIDRENNLKRKMRPSALYYGEICKKNAV